MNIRTLFNDLWTTFRRLYRERTEYTLYILELLVGLAVCFVTLYGFIELTEALLHNNIAWLDDSISTYIHGLRTPALTTAIIAFTQLGDAIAYIVLMLCVVVYFYFRRHNWVLSIQIAIVLISTASINFIIKNIIGRERPAGEHLVFVTAQSFPSGHAMSSIAFYGFFLYLAWRYLPKLWMKLTASIVFPALIAAIGFSRIYLGVHYPSDVMAGFAGGLCWLAVCILLFSSFRMYMQRRRNGKTETSTRV
jgi:membrane-associated phospholipid phosphatase